MNQQPINLTVLGLDITFKSTADVERVQEAANMLEKRFAEQKARSRGPQGKDIILTFLALGLSDELLRMKKEQEETNKRLLSLLAKIEKSL